MSDSEVTKVNDVKSVRGIALDHNSVAGAKRALRNKTANLSTGGAAARLSKVTSRTNQGTQPRASSTVVPSDKKRK